MKNDLGPRAVALEPIRRQRRLVGYRDARLQSQRPDDTPSAARGLGEQAPEARLALPSSVWRGGCSGMPGGSSCAWPRAIRRVACSLRCAAASSALRRCPRDSVAQLHTRLRAGHATKASPEASYCLRSWVSDHRSRFAARNSAPEPATFRPGENVSQKTAMMIAVAHCVQKRW